MHQHIGVWGVCLDLEWWLGLIFGFRQHSVDLADLNRPEAILEVAGKYNAMKGISAHPP